jgi:putative spermidine/putrescine transport system substrate-binding protein
MTLINNPRAFVAAQQGAPYAPVWNQAILAWEAWVIPKGAPNKTAAEAFLRWMRTPKAQDGVGLSVAFGSTVPNPKLPKGASKLVQEWLPTAPKNRAQTITMNAAWWSEHSDEAIERYTEWAAS